MTLNSAESRGESSSMTRNLQTTATNTTHLNNAFNEIIFFNIKFTYNKNYKTYLNILKLHYIGFLQMNLSYKTTKAVELIL